MQETTILKIKVIGTEKSFDLPVTWIRMGEMEPRIFTSKEKFFKACKDNGLFNPEVLVSADVCLVKNQNIRYYPATFVTVEDKKLGARHFYITI